MKDKLFKHHKPARYFLVRKILVIFSLALLIGATIAIPVTISAVRTHQTQERSN